jgi:hypothetical protein
VRCALGGLDGLIYCAMGGLGRGLSRLTGGLRASFYGHVRITHVGDERSELLTGAPEGRFAALPSRRDLGRTISAPD